MKTNNFENAVCFREISFENMFKVWDFTLSPIIMLLFGKISHFNENIHGCNDIGFGKDF